MKEIQNTDKGNNNFLDKNMAFNPGKPYNGLPLLPPKPVQNRNVITTQDKLYQALTAKSVMPDLATKEVLRYREALLLGFKLVKEKGFWA